MIATSPVSTSATESSVLIVTGMHQSGLSLASSLLEKTGWRMKGLGQSQIASDFIDFHESLLKRDSLDKTSLNSEDFSQAQQLISTHAESLPWGWVDPRTTLFLDFWQKQLPQAKFILIYRSPWDVVDAMYYHFSDQFKNQLELPIQLWLTYNEKLLNFYRQNSDNCILSHGDRLSRQPHDWINAMNTKFSTNLQNSPDLEKFSEFRSTVQEKNQITSNYQSLIKTYFPQALTLYYQLNQENWQPIIEDNSEDNPESQKLSQFQEWYQIRQQEKQIRDCESRLQTLQQELDLRMIQVYQTQEELIECEAKLQRNNEILQTYKLQQEISKTQAIEDPYQRLVLDAWIAYCQNRLSDMVQLLRSSSQHRQLSKTERIMDWLKQFEHFSTITSQSFHAKRLTHSPEWQQLVRHTVDV